MNIEARKLTAEQKQANKNMLKITVIVNKAISDLREVAPNGQHLQQLENSLVAYASLLCMDTVTECVDCDILPRLKKEMLGGREKLVPMTAEEAEKDRHYFDPQGHYFTPLNSKVVETICGGEPGKQGYTPLELIQNHLQSVLDTLVVEYPRVAEENKMILHHILEAWGEIIGNTKPTHITSQFWLDKTPPLPCVDEQLLSEALGAMGNE